MMYVQFCNEAKSCAYWLVNETLWYETETFDFQSETRSRPRPSHVSTRPRHLETTSRDKDVETETTSLHWDMVRVLVWVPQSMICPLWVVSECYSTVSAKCILVFGVEEAIILWTEQQQSWSEYLYEV